MPGFLSLPLSHPRSFQDMGTNHSFPARVPLNLLSSRSEFVSLSRSPSSQGPSPAWEPDSVLVPSFCTGMKQWVRCSTGPAGEGSIVPPEKCLHRASHWGLRAREPWALPTRQGRRSQCQRTGRHACMYVHQGLPAPGPDSQPGQQRPRCTSQASLNLLSPRGSGSVTCKNLTPPTF